MSISSGTNSVLAVGAPREDIAAGGAPGTVEIYQWSEGHWDWTPEKTLTHPTSSVTDLFGASVSLNGAGRYLVVRH